MALDWSSGELAAGLACYSRQQFFAAHEHWETVWIRATEPERSFLQALIHVTVAFHHQQRGNRIGAIRQLTRALRKLESYPCEFCGVLLVPLRANLTAWLTTLETGTSPKFPFPHIL